MRLKIILIFTFLFVLITSPVLARKKLTRKINLQPQVSSPGVWDKLKLRSDKNAILLMLGNMNQAESVTYNLTYTADNILQGVQGSHNPQDGNTQKELVFGTCSGNDCAYHQNITDMIFELVVKLTDGKTLTKKYQINP